MNHSPTVTAHYSQAMLQAGRRLGLSLPDDLVSALEQQERVDLSYQDDLWEQFCERADDPLVGLELGLALQMGHLDIAGMILMSCGNVGEAVDALIGFYPIVGEGSEFYLLESDDWYYLVYSPIYQVCRKTRVEASMANLLQFSRWSTGEQFRAQAITFRHAPQAAVRRYTEQLGVATEFGADHNALVFHHENMELPLIHANPVLCQHLRSLGEQMLTRMGDSTLSARVGDLIRREPRWGKDRIAEQLGMSGRNLVRKLADENTSFKFLRNTLLRERAEQALQQDSYRLADVAHELGFSGESAFIKAFKRWTGHTPARYRGKKKAESESTPLR